MEAANLFLNERNIGEFKAQFTVAPKQEGTAFGKTTRSDLNWEFTVQTERVVDRDNTVAIGDQIGQLEKSKTVCHRSHRPWGIPPSRDAHFSTATNNRIDVHPRERKPASASKRGASGSIH